MINFTGRYTGETHIDEMNRLIRVIIDILEHSKKEKIMNKWYYSLDHRLEMDYTAYLEVLLNTLSQKTTIEKRLGEKKCSINIFEFDKIFREIKNNKDNKNLYQCFF